ncbi:SAM-dependent methyltransferase [Candidatus Koribacter versatilis Ellin345]|uniref:SAM-dependent methyltransferase n=1 Tax=Koribacter versatilis (strain Ellin345) TaxID=204669 RepID=Q1IH83_KORVE|nr:class I SAM-dependent rRNA methyltransferase [Candidatus Koribacter versatilis]ABF43767.1 SAM-dependent methyltransferase [Candidatus Koribacter versatilis Ellin345]
MKPSKTATANPPIHLTPRGAARIRAGHVWVYRSDLKDQKPKAEPGSLVAVLDEKGRILGDALYSSSSQIAIRMFAVGREETYAVELPEIVSNRVAAAISYRDEVLQQTEACRLVFSEADFLPGLIVDRYNDILTMQVLTQAMDREDLRRAVMDSLREHFPNSTIFERVDERIRELEKLPAKESGVVGKPQKGNAKTATIFNMNGLRFHYDVSGQKTGAFLDQRENYAAAAQYARGDALDVFTYQGGFALHLYQNCRRVTGVDMSRPALEVAEENATLNEYNLEWIEANAFDYLKDQSVGGRAYDTIVLDPPAFAKTAKNFDTAIRGYKELNLRALKMLRAGGTLISCSCSFHVSEADFMEMLGTAAADAHRRVRILEKRNAAKDHPILMGVPETNYLKCIIARVD